MRYNTKTMRTLREAVRDAGVNGRALGHFNVSDSNQLTAVAAAARETGLPAIVGLSEGERKFFPIEEARLLINLYISRGCELYLNADHTYSLEKARQAIEAGVDSIVIDGAALPQEQNVALAAACVAVARASGRDVVVEGELGYIGKSSEVLERIPEGAAITEEAMTSPETAKAYVAGTGIDMLAPAVGNIHGIIAGGQPKLSIGRITDIAHAVGVPLVLHGGSGSPDEEFSAAIRAGIAIVHINTDLRLRYREGIERGLKEMPDEAAPYKFLAPAVEDMTRYVAQKMRLFAAGRAG